MTNAWRLGCTRGQAITAAALFAAAVAVTAAVGSVAAASSAEQYALLQRPGWAPPPWLFGPVWTILYVLIAFAGWRAWCAGPGTSRRTSTSWYALGLVLNALWTPLFFAAELWTLALLEIILLDVVVAVTAVLFWRRDRLAGALLVPYLVWTMFATVLNGAIVALN
ncbi:tryptophan-rich sensory protein [Saccharopolyspora subtropica]|uniref:Tryptophan-rich sensory protein n=1 Tax=Saccharopolyspora thermophila TaxID=89367 RepID=A0A917JTD3_9PSEU|nr:TspO/MBR family protein [Saccharopolyspora subtropica]GGI83765.1 tryptophan-rich sensory protein [Saccharopolyspora subtropica]